MVNYAAMPTADILPLTEALNPVSTSSKKPTRPFVMNWASYVGKKSGVAFANAVEAYVALFEAIPLEKGARVLVSACSTRAVWTALKQSGLEPVIREPDPYTMNLSGAELEKDIWQEVDAVILTHLYGRPAPVEAIVGMARKFGVFVIEDAQQAHGAEYRGRKVGAFGDAAVFCFRPGRVLADEEGGACVVTSLSELAVELSAKSGFKFSEDAEKRLSARMQGLEEAIEAREAVAENYRKHLGKVEGVRAALTERQGRHVWYRFVVRVDEAAEVQACLAEEGIETKLAEFPAIEGREDLPATQRAAKEILYLPVLPSSGEKAVKRVTAALKKCLSPVATG